MPWIYFLLAAGCFVIVLNAESALLLGLTLLAMLGLMLAGVLALASARINSRARNEAQILSSTELRALRERAAAGNTPGPAGAREKAASEPGRE